MSAGAPQDGVIRFDLSFTPGPALPASLLAEAVAWRTLLHRLGLIGQDNGRYGGAGFGNLSLRLPGRASPSGLFAVTGTQTGHLPVLSNRQFSVVVSCDAARNRVTATGPVPPSSESLTHGVLYLLDLAVNAVIHTHSPEIWGRARNLGIPVTPVGIPYGTPEMAREVERLSLAHCMGPEGLFAMGGHTDGVVAFGPSIERAATLMMAALARALADTVF